MSKALVPALLIALSTVVVTGKAGTLSASSGALSAPGCSVFADVPHAEPPAVMVAAAGRFRCDSPGGDITMRVSLQRRSSPGSWTTLAVRQFTASGADTTRRRSEAQRTRTVRAPCGPGTYRTLVTATVAGDRTRAEVQRPGRTVTDPCAPGRVA
jgi:hypothetical protein